MAITTTQLADAYRGAWVLLFAIPGAARMVGATAVEIDFDRANVFGQSVKTLAVKQSANDPSY